MVGDEPQESDLPEIRRSAACLQRSRSRLLQRGLVTLDEEHKVRLKVHGFLAFDSSVFILSWDWDAQPPDYWNHRAVDLTHSQRRLVLYEFTRAGQYVRRIVLPLAKFSEQGYALFTERFPQQVTIRNNFIHFYEFLIISESRVWIRVDYLFSRDGRCIARWSDAPYVEQYRSDDESATPVIADLEPVWFVGDRMFTIEPDGRDAATSTGNFVVSCSVPDLLQAIRQPDILTDANGRTYSTVSAPILSWRKVDIGEEPYSCDGVTWLDTHLTNAINESNDPGAAWFLPGCSRAYACRIEIDGKEPRVTMFPLPDPRELLENQVITLPDGWQPTDLRPDKWRYQGILSWRNLLVLTFRVENWSFESLGRRLLMRVDGHRLEAMRELLPQHDSFGRTVFSDGHFFWRSFGAGTGDKIMVTNIHSDETFRFEPLVPESELDPELVALLRSSVDPT